MDACRLRRLQQVCFGDLQIRLRAIILFVPVPPHPHPTPTLPTMQQHCGTVAAAAAAVAAAAVAAAAAETGRTVAAAAEEGEKSLHRLGSRKLFPSLKIKLGTRIGLQLQLS